MADSIHLHSFPLESPLKYWQNFVLLCSSVIVFKGITHYPKNTARDNSKNYESWKTDGQM